MMRKAEGTGVFKKFCGVDGVATDEFRPWRTARLAGEHRLDCFFDARPAHFGLISAGTPEDYRGREMSFHVLQTVQD